MAELTLVFRGAERDGVTVADENGDPVFFAHGHHTTISERVGRRLLKQRPDDFSEPAADKPDKPAAKAAAKKETT